MTKTNDVVGGVHGPDFDTRDREGAEEPVQATEKPAKRASVSLTAGGSKLLILAQRKADGSGVTTVTTTDAKKKSTRGMTAKFSSFAAACEAMKKLEHDAVQKGWKKTERVGGFKARPDAFTAMPVPPPSPKGKK